MENSRVVNFPVDGSIGKLTLTRLTSMPPHGFLVPSSEVRQWETVGEAAGTVTVPAGRALCLTVGEHVSGDLVTLENLGGDDLQVINLWHVSSLTEAGAARLGKLRGLRELILRDTQVDLLLRHLTGLTKLQGLDIEPASSSKSAISDKGLMHLADLSGLKWLSLKLNLIRDAVIAGLEGVKSLEFLNLRGTLISHAGLRYLGGLQQLKGLDVSGNWIVMRGMSDIPSLITDDGLAQLSQLTRLEQLDLSVTDITDAGLVHLTALTKLKYLGLAYTKIQGPGLASLSALKELRILDLEGLEVGRHVSKLERAIPNLAIESMG